MTGRQTTPVQMTSERQILRDYLSGQLKEFDTTVPTVEVDHPLKNPIDQSRLGLFRPPASRKAVITDLEMLENFVSQGNHGAKIPSFLEAGPRETLAFDPRKVRTAIVTTGGLAPGLHSVIHGIVKRHCETYEIGGQDAVVFGIYDGFRGLCDPIHSRVKLTPDVTEPWLDQGGSKLGSVRYYFGSDGPSSQSLTAMVEAITRKLESTRIQILYVIGGDGSLRVAHEIAKANPARSIVGIPKTIDNDVLWVWHSFGFETAVEQATHVINVLHAEAESTRRICVVELFGAESGFVAANATLASGHVDLVLIPEVFRFLNAEEAVAYLEKVVRHIDDRVDVVLVPNPFASHAVVVVAEGVGAVLQDKQAIFGGTAVTKENFVPLLKGRLQQVRNAGGDPVDVFENRPRHYIRAVVANAQDHIYCDRLGALAVDSALAGYTDFMVSNWQTEFVLVPLRLVVDKQKEIPVQGMFWKQVLDSTGQPLSRVEGGP
jgi:6-phosphofructokinase 1